MRIVFSLISWFAVTSVLVADEWVQSYDSGYFDANGAYAGGSEIMHLVAHKGKLFAANGYWVDARWEIPPDAEKQSAQVLRLEAADSQWQVDLDLGKKNDRGLRFMKGNILKSITIGGEQLLVMASGATLDRGGAVSVWVRDDETGNWTHTLVRHGSNAGGIRWVPRDLELYRDKITGEERLFLSLGNPGIISGVYDESAAGNIRWERHLEFPFPEEGTLRTRPLGIVEANGSLLFSAGGSIFQRIDGERPRYEKILTLGHETDADVGGVRGLTTIENSNGEGDSILFIWTPGERAKGQIKRLDPDGEGGYAMHDEANLADLMRGALDVEIGNVLGAHNEFYPIVDPATGETAHILGFQGNLRGKDDLQWKPSRYYAGALYAIRTANADYRVHEVNNAWKPGKPVLVTPRAFCQSPFGDGQFYIGGFDSNMRIADDRAWIFKAPMEVVSGKMRGADAEPSTLESPRLPGVDGGPVYELRVYIASDGRFQHLLTRFREHTDALFRKHGIEPLGYWTRIEGTPRERRTLYYLLKHPSRYEGWANWKRFTNDREWQRVLDRPEFQRLLVEKPVSIFMEGDAKFEPAAAGGIYELRTSVCKPGKLAEFRESFDGQSLGRWTPQDRPESTNTLIRLFVHESREQAASEIIEESDLLAEPPQRVFLNAIEFSPLK